MPSVSDPESDNYRIEVRDFGNPFLLLWCNKNTTTGRYTLYSSVITNANANTGASSISLSYIDEKTEARLELSIPFEVLDSEATYIRYRGMGLITAPKLDTI